MAEAARLFVKRSSIMGHLVKRAHTRTTSTPNATMTTLAQPTLGATGAMHVFDTKQIWTVIGGNAAIEAAYAGQ